MKLAKIALVLAAGLLAASTAFAGEGYSASGSRTAPPTSTRRPADSYISAYQAPEVGVGLQYWRLMSKDYAFTMNFGLGREREGPERELGRPRLHSTQSSFNLRVGGDRAVKVGDRAIFYFGPGIEYWTGKAEFEGFAASTDYETRTCRASVCRAASVA